MGVARSKAGVPYALPLDAFVQQQTEACLRRIVAAWMKQPSKRAWAERMATKVGTAEGALLLAAVGLWSRETNAVISENPTLDGVRTRQAVAAMDEIALTRVLSMSDARWWKSAEKVAARYDRANRR